MIKVLQFNIKNTFNAKLKLKKNVVQQSSGSQTPELQGNKDRVLVQFN